jgi:hypothetical protein
MSPNDPLATFRFMSNPGISISLAGVMGDVFKLPESENGYE